MIPSTPTLTPGQVPIILDQDGTTVIGLGMSGNWAPVDPSDPRLAVYNQKLAAEAAVAAAQGQYNAFRSLGMAVTCASDPALNGLYDISAQSEGAWSGSQAAAAQNVFCGFYHQMTGAKIAMSTAQFTHLATAAYTLIAAADDALATAITTGAAFVGPSNVVSIP